MRRGLLIWLLIMLVETIHGVLRGLFLAPRIGSVAADRVGWWVAAALVLAIAILTIRWTGVSGKARLLLLGAAWAILTAMFELLVGALRGLGTAELAAALNPATGSIPWTAGLMLVAPVTAAWLRGRLS